jgi:hypothetical protein
MDIEECAAKVIEANRQFFYYEEMGECAFV